MFHVNLIYNKTLILIICKAFIQMQAKYEWAVLHEARRLAHTLKPA